MSLPVRLADEGFYIPREDPLASYLDIEAIVSAAKEVGADAVHPGYGFLRKMLHLLSFYQKKELHSLVLRQSHLDCWETKLLLEKPCQRQVYL